MHASTNNSIKTPFHAFPGDPNYLGHFKPVVNTKGDPNIWRDLIRSVTAKNPGMLVALGAAAGAFLRGRVTVSPFVLHVFGPSSQGKTLALNIAASLIGRPDGPSIHSWDVTKADLIDLLKAFNHGFYALDESYFLKAGTAKSLAALLESKMTKDGHFDSTILSSGICELSHNIKTGKTKSIIDAHALQMDIQKFPVLQGFERDAASYKGILIDNHGHGYRPIIDAITHNHARYIEMHHDLVMDGQSAEWSLVSTGIQILRDALGLDHASTASAQMIVKNISQS